MDRDLMDHGAVSSGASISGIARDLPDIDLSDHGAVSYDTSLSGEARDLPDVDLSDHGAVTYESKKSYWGTNDEETIKNIDMLMHAAGCTIVADIIPHLNADSLAKLVNFRYSKVANLIGYNTHSLPKDVKEDLGKLMCLDFRIIDNIISSNPNGLQAIFNPETQIGKDEKTDIFGVIAQYITQLGAYDVGIPLIDAMTNEKLKTPEGKEITAQELLQFLMSKKETLQQENTGDKKSL